MDKKKVLLLLLMVTLLTGCLKNNSTVDEKYSSDPLPVREDIVQGKLDNGLKYYIMPNGYPEKKVEIRLNVRTGSLNETEEELGLAHFVEHMAFNGTRNFKGNDLIEFMEEAGLTFGKHSNAYTSTDVTNFQLSIPTDREGILEKGFMIIREWADGISFETEEIEKEKGVIVEEWRMRNDYRSRLRNMRRDILLKGSLYPSRRPIGDMDIVRGATRKLLKGYYDKWYTAENMSVIVVGDITVDKGRELIEKYFADMEKRSTPEHASKEVPLTGDVRFEVISDEEAPSLSLTLNNLASDSPVSSYDDYKRHILEQGVGYMFSKLMQTRRLSGETELYGFRAGTARIADSAKDYYISVTLSEANYQDDLTEFFEEIEGVKRYGFTLELLKEFKDVIHQALIREAREDKVVESSDLTRTIVRYDTSGGDFMTPAQELAVFEKVISEVNITSFNRTFKEMLKVPDRVVILALPDKLKDSVSIELSDIEEAMAAAQKAELTKLTSSSGKSSLMDSMPEPAEITERKYVEELESEMVKLSNGAVLYLRTSDLKKHNYTMTAIRPGGRSVLGGEEYTLSSALDTMIATSGFTGMDRNSINRIKAGHKINIAPKVTEYYESFSGGGDSQDIEMGFQFLNRYLTAFEITDVSYKVALESLEKELERDKRNKFSVFMRSILPEVYNENYRRLFLKEEDLNEFSKEKFASVYQKIFSDIDGYIFVISGDLDKEKVIDLFAGYIGGIKPAGNKDERTRYIDREVRLAKKDAVFTGKGEIEPKTTVIMRYESTVTNSLKNRLADTLASMVLKKELRREVREELGGVYSITGFYGVDLYRDSYARGMVRFTCDPERTDELVSTVEKTLHKLAEKGVGSEDFEAAKKQLIQSIEDSLNKNSFWVSAIAFTSLFEDDLKTSEDYREYIRGFKIEDVNSFIAEFAAGSSRSVIKFEPEEG